MEDRSTQKSNTRTASTESQPPEAHANDSAADNKKTLGFWSVIGSVFAAVFGIQSQKNRERDFKKGNPSDYIVMGIIFVFILVVAMIVFVNSILPG